ncbi:TetR/AcrR family transcriptional regulator [Microbacterium sp. NPDC091313]
MPTPDRTSLAEIVRAASALLDEAGPAAVTMQAVAGRVGVKAPSLYKRVRDRDALLAHVASAAADDLTARLDATGGELADLAHAFRAFGSERPEAFRLLFSVAADPEAAGRASEPVLRAAVAAVGERHALEAARLLTAWVTGFVTMELAGAFRLGGDLDAAFAYGLDRVVVALESDHDLPAHGS